MARPATLSSRMAALARRVSSVGIRWRDLVGEQRRVVGAHLDRREHAARVQVSEEAGATHELVRDRLDEADAIFEALPAELVRARIRTATWAPRQVSTLAARHCAA